MCSMLKHSFLATLAICLVATVPLQAQQGTITGVVTEASSGRALTDARVSAYTEGGRVVRSTSTSADGRYSLAVPPGTYELVVESIGYEPTTAAGTVTVTAGGTARSDIALTASAFKLNPIVTTVSGPRSALGDVAHVTVLNEEDMERPAATLADVLRGTAGVDIVTQGIQSTNVVVRGFNNIFSGALLTLTDHRIAGVPSLRLNALHFIPSTVEDVDRMEVVLGPAAALYGPNTASGVLHMFTKSPLTKPESSFSLMGGQQGIMQGSGRIGVRLSDRVGFKVSGTVLSANEWAHSDNTEESERIRCTPINSLCRADMINSLGLTPAEADARIARIGNRDFDIRRWNGEARLDWQVAENATAVFQGGVTNVGNAIELTGLGAAQAKDWRYTYYQARLDWNRLFVQGYLNQSDAGDTFLLRNGQPIVDESTLMAGQIRHGFTPRPWQVFTYGADVLRTNPQTHGTINGLYEDEDETTEVGAYIQSETALHPKFDLVLAGRVDDHSALPDLVFSPRAALLFKPTATQSFRATYNRAFSTPTSLNQYLDLPTAIPNEGAARLGFSVRVQGTGTNGFSFRQGDGSYLMRSPFTPAGLGGPTTLLPAHAVAFYPATVQVLMAGGLDPALGAYLLTLQPTPVEIGTNFIPIDGHPCPGNEPSCPISNLALGAINPIRETTTSMFELGYKGVLRDRFSLSADLWFSRIDDFVTPLTVSTPLLAMNGQQIAQYLAPRFMQDLGMSQQQAVATATQVATAMAGVPVGVVSSADVHATGAQLLTTYTNVPESINLWGTDIALQALLAQNWSVTAIASFVKDDVFQSERVGTVTLNAPKRKGALALEYRNVDNGFSGELRGRYNASFPVQSGVYRGTRCIEPGNADADPCVESYTLLDATVGYALPQIPGASLHLSVQNVLDEQYRSFPGVPNIGRLALLRLRYEF